MHPRSVFGLSVTLHGVKFFYLVFINMFFVKHYYYYYHYQ
jgi:hypothetical protein